MWEALKSVAFVIFTVMVALILQARAEKVEFDDQTLYQATEEMQVLPTLSVDLK